MSTRFLPTRENALDTWLLNFSTLISAAPASYGLSAGDAAQVATAVADWHAAFEIASSLTTRTQGSVATKRAQKRNVVRVARGYAARVRSNAAVSAELKINLGLKLRSPAGSPVPVPTARPALVVARTLQGLQDVRAVSPERLHRRGKPPGVAALLVFRAIADGPVHSADQAEYFGLVTKGTFTSTFTPAHRGKIVTYFARWTNAKGEAGPWSQGLSAAITA